ncbi:3-oxoacyl-ACP synthase [Nonomuraea sp. FMUSA5-5]|uniref:3-oxoacyl-ACP synthase n=1 Tax=Nonomuraea composti TaxID=2720023 RepID=A0ABX1BKP6_9ACTN|nr:beta-ketoacyl synthase N-terminal-like domain-containing protein [Nonomuraea sp. FMUSA5-5]NJP96346.1 3-oxoacyl-ACP synthase [Nonomuraea sp. FMUSA5-5]
MTGDVVVTGVGIVAPGTAPPTGRSGGPSAGASSGPSGSAPGGRESWFDVAAELGPRGYKYLPPASQYLLAAARRAVAAAGGLEHAAPHRRAAAVGTNGALRAYFDDVDAKVTGGHSDDLSPAGAPYFAVNVLSGRLASEHLLKAFSLTLTSPRVAGFEAVETGARALALGRADVLVAAAMEHGLPHHAPGLPMEQGAVAIVLEPRARAEERGATVLGTCFARAGFAPPGLAATSEGRRRLAEQVERAVAELGAADAEVYQVLDGSPVSRALEAAAGAAGLTVRPAVMAGGGCLAPSLLLARSFVPAERPRLVITATAEGNFALAGARPAPAHRESPAPAHNESRAPGGRSPSGAGSSYRPPQPTRSQPC